MKKKKVLIGLGLVVLLGLAAGCGNQEKTTASSVSSVEKTTAKESTTTESSEETPEMNFAEIQKGNYQSMMGEWELVAAATNFMKGNGVEWTEPGDGKLTITPDTINFGKITLKGAVLNDGEEKPVTFEEKEGKLYIDTPDTGILWNLALYQKNIPLDKYAHGEPQNVDQTKERFVFRTSNMGSTAVFQRKSEETVNTSQETAASSTTESSAPAAEAPKMMNLAEIRSGNYASLAGTWQNALGATITITDTTMSFSDLTSFGKAGTVTGTTVDIPADNAPDGSPKMVEAFGGQGPAYEKQLELEDNGSYLVLRGSVPGAGLFISFYPPGTSGTARSGDINQERIIALVTQADLVTEEMAYHRVN